MVVDLSRKAGSLEKQRRANTHPLSRGARFPATFPREKVSHVAARTMNVDEDGLSWRKAVKISGMA
jgi:hypothetical protein